MFKVIQKLFDNKKSKKSPEDSDLCFQTPDAYRAYIVNSSESISEKAKPAVLGYIQGKGQFWKTDNILSKEDKVRLGFNTRCKITWELVDILSEAGQKLNNPEANLSELFYMANIGASKIEHILNMRKAGIKQFYMMSCNNGQDCPWCTANANVEVATDINIMSLIEKNCTCQPYCKCIPKAILKFG